MPEKALTKIDPGKPKQYQAPKISHRTLTKKHIHVASLEASGKTNAEIFAHTGITWNQLNAMRKAPKYQAELARQVGILAAKVSGSILGDQVKRVAIRDKLYEKIEHVIDQRAAQAKRDKALAKQGGLTGLVVQEPVYDKRGKVRHIRYTIDHPTVDQIKSLANETARDLGQLGGDRDGQGSVTVNITFTPEDEAWL